MAALPRVAVLLTAYQHEAFITAALRGALAQSWPLLDVVVSDDGSIDGTWAAIEAVARAYKGPHRLIPHRQPQNVGPGQNLLDGMALTEAEYIVLAHGDDVSSPDRVGRVVTTMLRTGAALVSHSARRGERIESATELVGPRGGGPVPLLEICKTAWIPKMLGATFSWHRRVFSEFGPLDRSRLPRGGDHVLPLRGALLGGFYYLDEPLVFWRRHASQMTSQTADFQGSEQSRWETMAAYDITAQLYRLDELRGFASRHGWTPELRAGEAAIRQTMMARGLQWDEARTQVGDLGLSLHFRERVRPRPESA